MISVRLQVQEVCAVFDKKEYNQTIEVQKSLLLFKLIYNIDYESVINSIKNYISSVAIEATRNILLQNLSKDKKSALIEESISEFNSVLKN